MATEEVRAIGERVEPFVDEWLIARLDGTELRLQHPVRQEVVMVFDRPWEGNTSGYPVIFEDEGRFRLYYRGSHTADGTAKADYDFEQEMLCFAESRDGIQWERPDLGLVEYHGSTANNIIMPTAEGGDTFSVIRDDSPNATPEERYKAGTGIMDYGFLRWFRATDCAGAGPSPIHFSSTTGATTGPKHCCGTGRGVATPPTCVAGNGSVAARSAI